ncbi:hypothetical protein FHX52_4214 [Humibacillus xanthopallidus]|uniref:Uncharacterized protein n=1 Tax=Humibacillus xanthopallidus TaxID=412689 RepID=A0A543PLP7_9MICO|nr:hypothetical protein FHX52_4214 [Humibacillus xanthopallidus]
MVPLRHQPGAHATTPVCREPALHVEGGLTAYVGAKTTQSGRLTKPRSSETKVMMSEPQIASQKNSLTWNARLN